MRVSYIPMIAAVLAACYDANPTASIERPITVTEHRLQAVATSVNIAPTAEELELRTQLRALYPGATGDRMLSSLDDPDSRLVSKNPAGQALLDKIYASRKKTQTQRPGLVPVTVALVGAFDKPGVTARVLRMASGSPANVIVLSNSTRSAATLGTAMRILSREIRLNGEVGGTDKILEISGSKMPAHWSAEMIQGATEDLESLSRADRSTVQGLGRVRSIVLWMRSPTKNLTPRG